MKYLLGAVLIAALSSGAWANEHMGGPGQGPGQEHEKASPEKMKEKLGLTDAQFEKFKEAKEAMEKAGRPMREDLAAEMARLREQLSNKAEDKDIAATLDKLEKARKGMDAAQDKFKADMALILTPTQRAKMLMGMMGQRHGGMMQGGMRKKMRGKGGGRMKEGPEGDGDGEDDDDGPEHPQGMENRQP